MHFTCEEYIDKIIDVTKVQDIKFTVVCGSLFSEPTGRKIYVGRKRVVN